MAINFTVLTDNQKLDVADLIQKLESIDGALADIQTERAVAQSEWAAREQELNAEKNTLKQNMRNIRKPTLAAIKI